jgi:hypothetical protein
MWTGRWRGLSIPALRNAELRGKEKKKKKRISSIVLKFLS